MHFTRDLQSCDGDKSAGNNRIGHSRLLLNPFRQKSVINQPGTLYNLNARFTVWLLQHKIEDVSVLVVRLPCIPGRPVKELLCLDYTLWTPTSVLRKYYVGFDCRIRRYATKVTIMLLGPLKQDCFTQVYGSIGLIAKWSRSTRPLLMRV